MPMASRNVASSPTLWIIAGPNGSGKSSLYSTAAFEEAKGSIWIINPDVLAARISEQEKLPLLEANTQAVIRIEQWLYASIDTHQTVGVETVLSTPKYQKLVETAHSRGFHVRLIFVFLDDVELNVERVAARVRKGGHAVPADKIRGRRRRSFEQLSWFLARADSAEIYDNSGATPKLVAWKRGDEFALMSSPIEELRLALERSPGIGDALRG